MSNTNLTKTGSEIGCSGRVSSSCSTRDTHRAVLVTNPVLSLEWRKEWIVFTTNGTHMWSCVTQIFRQNRNFHVYISKNSILCNYGFHEKLISIIIKLKVSYFRKQEGQDGFSEWLLLKANSAFLQLYHGENKLIFNEMMMMFGLF